MSFCWIGFHRFKRFSLGPKAGYTSANGVSVVNNSLRDWAHGKICWDCRETKMIGVHDVTITREKNK